MKNENVLHSAGKQLDSLSKDILKLDKSLALFAKGKKRDEKVYDIFKVLINRYPANSLVLGRLLEFLQLTDGKKIGISYDLKEMDLLYSKLTGVYSFDVEIHSEYYHYLYSARNKEKRAKQGIEKFKKKIDKTIPK